VKIKTGTVVALIPARSGSKGVPNKNVKLLEGKPLISYTIAIALKAANIDRVLVSTDSETYASISKEYGAEVPFLRPVDIASHTSTDYEFVKHTLDWFEQHEGQIPELIVHMRPTTPLREVRYIEAAINLFRKNSASALRSVHEMPESAYKSFEIENGCLKSIGAGVFDLETANAPRQQFPKTYAGNGYVDVLRSRFVLEAKKIYGGKVIAFVTPFIGEVDSAKDFQFLEYQIAKNPSIADNIFS